MTGASVDTSKAVEIPTDPSQNTARRYQFPALIKNAETIGAADTSGVVIVANGATARGFDYVRSVLDSGGGLHVPYAGNESYFTGAGSYLRLSPSDNSEIEIVSSNGDYGTMPRADLEATLIAIAPIEGLQEILQNSLPQAASLDGESF